MKRSIGITISAVIAIVGSAFSILVGLLMVGSSILERNAPIPPPAAGQPALPISPAVMIAFISIFYFGSGVWGIVSAIGVLRLRNWARICFAVFGGILCVTSIFGTFGLLTAMRFIPQTQPADNNVPPGLITGIFAAFGILALLGAALGVWWVIYFNRSKVKAQFLGEAVASAPRLFPLSIAIIAWILVVGGLCGLPGLFLFSYPFLLFGFVLHGAPARLIYLLFVVVGIISGAGMLRKHVGAHTLAVGYFVLALLNVLSYTISPTSFTRFMQEIPGAQNLPLDFMNAVVPISNVFGLVTTGLMLWFLITRRQRFIEACESGA